MSIGRWCRRGHSEIVTPEHGGPGLGIIRYAGKVGDEANRKSIALTRAPFIEHCVPDLRIVSHPRFLERGGTD